MDIFFGNGCEEVNKNYQNILVESGYPWEEHEVTTEDGYINSMYRIPYGKENKSNNNKRRPPVLLGHGLNCCGAVFFNQSRLAYYLADQGYDVWLLNNRGTTLSRKHVTLNPEKDREKYWDFSWHEIGYYDLPAFVDYVIERTKFKKVYYIGHSQGTAAYAVLASERQEYNDKIILSCMLGSIIGTEFKLDSYVLMFCIYILIPSVQLIETYLVGLHELPFSKFLRLITTLTNWNTLGRYINLFFFFLLTGKPDYHQASELDMKKFARTEPNGCALRQVYHYSQIMRRKRFAKYDYGSMMNIRKYGSVEPPVYNLSKITSPVALFYGKNDMFNDYRTDKLDKKMSNVVNTHIVEDDLFNHVDFLIAKDSISLVYKHIVKIMKEYESE